MLAIEDACEEVKEGIKSKDTYKAVGKDERFSIKYKISPLMH